ncbi:uncharacterized protein [Eurosta solidaginis]|uniref:uncharacterized protein isoform X2 n=1 Tax=Eurosta solidaginis TaxID=178769 RepID=UPI00353155E2
MSWAPQSPPALAPTLPQPPAQQPPPQQSQQNPYSQQQKLQTNPVTEQPHQTFNNQQQSLAQANSNTNQQLKAAPAPPLVSNLPPTTGAYLNKPITANNNNNSYNALQSQHNSIRSQMHANGGATHQQPTQQHQPGHFGAQQPPTASAAWPQETYVQPTKIMQPNIAAANNWPSQQLQQQQEQQNQKHSSAEHNIWQPPDVQAAPASNNIPIQQQQQYSHQTTYDNYFSANQTIQQQQLLPLLPLPPAAQPTQHEQTLQSLPHDKSNYFQPQQQQPQSLPTQPVAEFFDNNNTNKSDGWGDWDWNDNGNVISGEVVEQAVAGQQSQHQQPTQLPIHKPTHPEHQHQAFDSKPTNYANSNVIADSFSTQPNDNWNWNLGDGVNTNANTVTLEKPQTQPSQVPTTNSRQTAQVPRQLANIVQVPQQKIAEFAETESSGNFQAKPTSLPLSEITNENYNTSSGAHSSAPILSVASIAATTNTNIPNSVYVSQAKPVSRPSRQYASPPGVASPTNDPLVDALTPPQGFQNEISPTQQETVLSAAPPAVANSSIPLQTPSPAMTPPSNLPPPPGVGAAAGNPFKRAGAPQHHRVGLLATSATATTVQQLPTAAIATAFTVPPPPPANFANPLLSHLEPDNSEILHENQEVLGITMSSSSPSLIVHPTSQTITLPGASMESPGVAQAALQPPPNDERNQYLQTSPLSENPDEELNLEADSLPPPGLSRLVLGQPELLEGSQRMVTGTEEPANMHRDERHADGEDTSLEQVPPVALLNVSSRITSVGASSTSASNNNTIDITTDRNLYLVPGESNAHNEPRVVTGVEMSPETNAIPPPPQIASGRREIELDGENLEDQQQLHQSLLPGNSRDEPPLEGAAATAEPTAPVAAESQEGHHHHHHTTHHHHHHHQMKSKDLSNASTGNDESDPLTDNQHLHHHGERYTGINKQRKHSNDELERRVTDRHQRRDKQRSSADRYESDDLELDGTEPYSSDRDNERDRERRRGYREGSVRSDREREEREYAKDKRRRGGGDKRDEHERDKLRDKYYVRESGKSDAFRRSTRHNRQYEENVDDVTGRRKEQSRRSGARHHNEDRAGRSDRSEREYDDYNRRPRGANKRSVVDKNNDDGREARRSTYVEDERREQRRTRPERGNDYDTIERRHRAGAGDKSMRAERGDAREYEEYRKQSSRNAREIDLEKERARYDPRHAAMYGYAPGSYGYDPYASYYYEQMARTNPQAYSEWYKKYYGHAAATTAATLGGVHATASGDHASLNSSSLAAVTADGRESVHSGRSSVQNDKERYTHAYISQANEYHRHLQQRHMHTQQNMIYSQQQHTNMSLNSTMLDDSKAEVLHTARSTSNLSQIGSSIGGGGGGVSGLTAYYAGVGGIAGAYYARSDYAESRSGHLSLRDADAIAESDPQRLTPRKFVNEHTIVTLSAGIIVTVKPKYTSHGAISNIVKLHRLGANDATRQLFQAYPGPLVRGLTHKKTIIEFCEEQIRMGPMETTIYAKQLVCNNIEKYRGSYTLMWNLLILLLRQNGMVVGTDIAELLLKNQQQFPYQIENSDGNVSSLSSDEAEVEQIELTAAEQRKSEDVVIHETDINATAMKQTPKSTTNICHTPTLSEVEITEKFRNYLLYGNVNEALDWATDNNLWGHALFLASKVDRRSHANVMMKFANKLSLNDPLQTLYQLMSGRQPSSVTSVQDEKWGDWRPHLSMILSNTSQKPELDRKSITTLGDSLLNRGDLFAAHFCYLMAQVGFGRYQEFATQESTLQQHLPKLVLLGTSHYKTFNDFATNEAIIMTEIYEYACSLNDEKFSLVEFQPYKYLLATRLLDYGYHLRSLMYFEQIALHIQRDPSKYELSFINKIYEFADRLKYYDPVLERSLDEQQQNADDNSNNNQLANFEEQKWLQDLRAIAVQHKTVYTSSAAVGYDPIPDAQTQIDQQFVELNKQFNALNMQYNNHSNTEQVPTFYNPDTMQQQQQELQQQQQQHIHNDYNHQQQQPTAVAADYNSQQVNAAHSTDAMAEKPADANDPYAYYNQQQSQQHYMQPEPQQQQQEPTSIPYYDPTQQLQPQQQQQAYQGYGTEAVDTQNNAGSYDYWGQERQQQQGSYGDAHAANDLALETTTKTASEHVPYDSTKNIERKLKSSEILALKQMLAKDMPTTKAHKTTLESSHKIQQQPIKITPAAAKLYNSYDGPQTLVAKKANINHINNQRTTSSSEKQQQLKSSSQTTSFLSTLPNNARPTISMPKSKIYDSDGDKQQKQQNQQKNSANDKKNDQRTKNEKETNKSSQQGNQNSGWFGGIFNKLSLKPKNQMILPDDKNPSIVWDPDKKRWVNTDGDEATEESLKPPPKMSDIMGQMPPTALPSQSYPQQQQQQLQQMPQQQQLQPQPQPQLTQAPQPSPLLDTHQYAGAVPSQAVAPAPAPISGYSAHALTGADAAGTTKTPSLQSNMFKMQRNRTLKNSYVDVFNPSGAPMKTTENVLAPALPPAALPQSGFFIPGSAPVAATGDNNDDGAYQQQQQQQQQPMLQQDVPQFYNPNQFGGGAY